MNIKYQSESELMKGPCNDEYSNEMKPNWSKANGLLPCVVQDYDSARVLMLGFVNADSLEQSIKTGKLCFFSRSRQKLWMKGETSGNFLILKRLFIDCDNDSFFSSSETNWAHLSS